MNITQQESPPELLEFALITYAKPGVESVCLALQDQFSGQVNILLWAAWLDSQNCVLDHALLDQARAAIWTQECYGLRPLRALRRLTPKSFTWLRGSIKRLELKAEFWQLRRLALYTSSGAGPRLPDNQELGYRVVYLRSLAVPEAFERRVDMLLG